QAEDGIRYRNVTGVQTCALPIYGYPETEGLRGNFFREDYKQNIDDALEEKDEEVRLDYLIDAEKILLEDEAGLGPLYFEGQAFLEKDYVKNIIVHPYGASLELKEA